MKGKRRFQILFSGEHHYTDEEFMDKTDIFDEIMTEIFGCDWGCSMCMDFQGYEKVEAIPISFIEKLIEERIEQEQWELDTYGEYNQMAWVYSHLIDEWRKENENDNI